MSRRFGSLDTDKELQNTEVEELERQLAVLRDESDSLEEVRAQQRAAWAEAQSALKAVLNEIEQTEAHLSELKRGGRAGRKNVGSSRNASPKPRPNGCAYRTKRPPCAGKRPGSGPRWNA